MAGAFGRNDGSSNVQTISKAIAYTQGNGAVVTVGQLPAGAIVLRGTIAVTEAFNAGTANTAIVGPTTDTDGYATALALGTIGNIAFDEMATTNDQYLTTEQTIVATLTLSGTAPTTGAGFVVVEYMVPAN